MAASERVAPCGRRAPQVGRSRLDRDRILAGDIFGLEKLCVGDQIYSQLVGDYQEKSLCIAQVSEFAELMGCAASIARRSSRSSTR